MVIKSKEANPIYNVFDINQYEFTLKPSEKFELNIFYKPNLPNIKNCDHFGIMDSANNFHKLFCSGRSLGPAVHCSIRYLDFVHSSNQTFKRQTFVMTNSSKIDAIFHFDYDSDHNGIFEVKPLYGTVKKGEDFYVNITFKPKTYGIYSNQLCCLILYHVRFYNINLNFFCVQAVLFCVS